MATSSGLFPRYRDLDRSAHRYADRHPLCQADQPILLAVGLIPMIVDGGLQAISSYQSNNTLRLVTGIIAGVVAALLLCEFAARYLEVGTELVHKDAEPKIAPKGQV